MGMLYTHGEWRSYTMMRAWAHATAWMEEIPCLEKGRNAVHKRLNGAAAK